MLHLILIAFLINVIISEFLLKIYDQRKIELCHCVGATENAGVENAIRAKLQGWKMQEWKKTGVDSRGGKCRSKLYGAPTRVYIDRILN